MRTLSLAFMLLIAPLCAGQEIGPAKGSLVIVGGGLQDLGILRRFLELAGGHDAPIVVIPTAGEDDEYDDYWSGLDQLKQVGARRLQLLHTRDRRVADTEAFVAPIRAARGVWLPGGRHWRLADSYLNTRTPADLSALLGRGGVFESLLRILQAEEVTA